MPFVLPAVSTPLIPRAVLFGNPVKTKPKISPDGTKMAYIAPVDDVLNVWVKTIGAEDDRPVTEDDHRGIFMYFWAQDNSRILYLQDCDGDENWRLYGVDLETGETRDYTPFEKVTIQIEAHSKQYPNELIIAMNKEDERFHDVYHLDLGSGELRLVAKNPGNVGGWVVDACLQVRGAMVAKPDGGFDLLVRETEADEWRLVVKWDVVDSLTSGPVGFSRDGGSLYLLDSRGRNAGALMRMNLATGALVEIASDQQYDIGSVFINPDTKEVQAVSFYRERNEWLVLDETIRDDFARLQSLQRGDFHVYNRDNEDRIWLVGFDVDNGPISFYAYDRESGSGTLLFHNQPALLDHTLATMEPISVTARDGLAIHAYLTCPAGLPRTKLPMVVNVHGGPHHRDTWGYDPEAQWFANRGYACLQINFRGSTGYGKAFLNAGDKQWAAAMHDDLIDVADWVVAQGIADPDRIAVYGGSYGGYAALVGATFTPDYFTCAIDLFGPSNVASLIESIPPYWTTFLANLKQRVGDPETEPDLLRSMSPLFKVDQIRIPMLIAQGANDPRVKQAESEQIVDAMKNKGIEHEYILFPDEGHGFMRPENRLKFYAIAEKFLARHLGGRCETC
ncbi:S9 family peptidase [bacterium]|nr:S9 family peptidase [candidate division CSSED10-310 bacterium]